MRWRLVEGVPDEDVQRLVSVARRRRFARREVVFHRDDPADSLHLIVKGGFAVRIMTPLGETVTIGLRGPGDSFGEMALVGPEPRRSATVERSPRSLPSRSGPGGPSSSSASRSMPSSPA